MARPSVFPSTSENLKATGILFVILSGVVLLAVVLINNKMLNRLTFSEGFSGKQYKLVYYKKETCPHCKTFESEWESLRTCIASYLKTEGRNCDISLATEVRDVSSAEGASDVARLSISGIPQLVLLTPSEPGFVMYNGLMKQHSVVAWLNTILPCRITC